MEEKRGTDMLPWETADSGRPRRRHRLRNVLLVLGSAVLVLVLALGGGVFWLAHKYDSQVERVPDVFASIPKAERPQAPRTAAQNFLLVGSDSRADVKTTGSTGDPNARSPIGQRSDTIMIVHLPADRGAAWVISVPRDSWVAIPGHGTAKINAAYAYGGPALLVRTLEQLTGVHIDHYAEIDFAGFEAMTDAVGGVDITVPRDSYDTANEVRWHAGRQHLDGERALLYVRQRYGLPHGDFDRMAHQQQFLSALLDKATSKGMLSNPLAVGRLIDALTRSVSVDESLSAGDLRSLAWSLRGLSRGDLHFLTLPVRGTGREGAQSVVYLDRSKDAKLYAAIRADALANWRS